MAVRIKNPGSGENVTPQVTVQTPLVQEILESLVGKVTLANATPETILEGYSAYVGRQLVTGMLELMENNLGFSEVAYGTITPSVDTSKIYVNPKFQSKPKIVFCFTEYFNYASYTTATDNNYPVAVVLVRYTPNGNSTVEFVCKKGFTSSNSTANLLDEEKAYIAYAATLKAGAPYTWIALA